VRSGLLTVLAILGIGCFTVLEVGAAVHKADAYTVPAAQITQVDISPPLYRHAGNMTCGQLAAKILDLHIDAGNSHYPDIRADKTSEATFYLTIFIDSECERALLGPILEGK
jgi:hypothetical protein